MKHTLFCPNCSKTSIPKVKKSIRNCKIIGVEKVEEFNLAFKTSVCRYCGYDFDYYSPSMFDDKIVMKSILEFCKQHSLNFTCVKSEKGIKTEERFIKG